MKKNLLAIAVSFTAFVSAQTYNNSGDWAKLEVIQKSSKLIGDDLPKNVEGSMYYVKDFISGNLYFDSKRLDREFEYRYNAYLDEIEVKSNEGMDVLAKSPKLKVEIIGMTYKYVPYNDKSGVEFSYMVEIFSNSNYTVFQKNSKKLKQGRKSSNGMTPDLASKLVDETSFYVQFSDDKSAISFPSSKKELIQMYPELKNGLKKFIKSEKIDFDKSEDVLKVMDYCYAK